MARQGDMAMVLDWEGTQTVNTRVYTCGHCGAQVGSDTGYDSRDIHQHIVLCPVCERPTYFNDHHALQVPGARIGADVEYIPPESAAIYREARNCMTVNAYTAVVLLCRTLLMHIAVGEGAKEKEGFAFYVKYLIDAGYVAPKSRPWVEQIRQRGNTATHEITPVRREEAEEMIALSQMVLQLVYEYPNRGASPA